MKTAGSLIALACMVCALAPGAAAQWAAPQSNSIEVVYAPPQNPAHQPIYERLKERRALVMLQQMLSPFRLPRTLTVKVEGCDGDSNAWFEDDAVTVCYEYLHETWRNAFKTTRFEGVAQIDVMLGPAFDVFLHEFGHAVFELLDVPLFGREEDAADQFSALIMLQFNKEEARRLILGTAYAYKVEVEGTTEEAGMTDFADEHGTPAQRFYNLLCVAYGAEPELFTEVVKKGYLPKDRAEGCEEEYAQAEKAWRRLIEPHIDQALVQAMKDRGLVRTWLAGPAVKLKRPGKSKSSRAK
jgi:hypothetical protein